MFIAAPTVDSLYTSWCIALLLIFVLSYCYTADSKCCCAFLIQIIDLWWVADPYQYSTCQSRIYFNGSVRVKYFHRFSRLRFDWDLSLLLTTNFTTPNNCFRIRGCDNDHSTQVDSCNVSPVCMVEFSSYGKLGLFETSWDQHYSCFDSHQYNIRVLRIYYGTYLVMKQAFPKA